jgi:hypothetical protein
MTDRMLSCMLIFSRKRRHNYKQSKRKRNLRFQDQLKKKELRYLTAQVDQYKLASLRPHPA